jgi:hypothetical protein
VVNQDFVGGLGTVSVIDTVTNQVVATVRCETSHLATDARHGVGD